MYNILGPQDCPQAICVCWKISQASNGVFLNTPLISAVYVYNAFRRAILCPLSDIHYMNKRAVLVSSLNGVEDVLQPSMFVLFIGILAEKCVYKKNGNTDWENFMY